jgi:hypothetical protein
MTDKSLIGRIKARLFSGNEEVDALMERLFKPSETPVSGLSPADVDVPAGITGRGSPIANELPKPKRQLRWTATTKGGQSTLVGSPDEGHRVAGEGGHVTDETGRIVRPGGVKIGESWQEIEEEFGLTIEDTLTGAIASVPLGMGGASDEEDEELKKKRLRRRQITAAMGGAV